MTDIYKYEASGNHAPEYHDLSELEEALKKHVRHKREMIRNNPCLSANCNHQCNTQRKSA